MKSRLRNVNDHGKIYVCLAFCCPGCVAERRSAGWTDYEGLHMLPVNVTEDIGKPSWTFDGNLEAPTLSPSILTKSKIGNKETRCHSYLRNGVFEFLSDCTHSLVNQHVPMPDLPDWATEERRSHGNEST